MREVDTPDPPNANSDNRCTISVVYEAVFGSCEFCEFAGVLAMSWRWFGPNSISVTRQFNLMASDLLVVTDFLAWRLAREQVAEINPPRGSDELYIHASIGHECRLDLMVQRIIIVT